MEMLICCLGGLALIASGLFLSRLAPPNWEGDVDPLHRERAFGGEMVSLSSAHSSHE